MAKGKHSVAMLTGADGQPIYVINGLNTEIEELKVAYAKARGDLDAVPAFKTLVFEIASKCHGKRADRLEAKNLAAYITAWYMGEDTFEFDTGDGVRKMPLVKKGN